MILNTLLNFFLPKICGSCSKILTDPTDYLCIACELQLIANCKPDYIYIKEVFKGRVHLHNSVYFIDFNKKGAIQKVMHNIKYKNQQKLALYLSEQLIKKVPTDFFKNIDLLIPVPLHKKKEKERGYNQSLLIAQGIQKIYTIPINTTILTRKLQTESQTTKSKLNRWKNVKNAFTLENNLLLNKKHILLIDDVFTTGATIEACIKTIQANTEACKCSILTIARA